MCCGLRDPVEVSWLCLFDVPRITNSVAEVVLSLLAEEVRNPNHLPLVPIAFLALVQATGGCPVVGLLHAGDNHASVGLNYNKLQWWCFIYQQ